MEKEVKIAEKEEDDAASKGESSVDMSNSSPAKRGTGRPKGSKKLQVCVTDVNLMELVSGISNGESTAPHRGRGRPRLSTNTVQQGSADGQADNSVQTGSGQESPRGSKKLASNEDHVPRKRGRPLGSLNKSTLEKVAATDLPNGGTDTPKRGRGRPKGTIKRKSETTEEGSSATPRKRGRPKGSLNKKSRLSGGQQDVSNGISKTPRRGRGRPRKNIKQQKQVSGVSQSAKRGRGRPKGSLNKKPATYKVQGKVGRPRREHVSTAKSEAVLPIKRGKRGRPRKQPAKRGRPRKYPLPSPDELKKPKVWKPLGRPRKYARVDPPEGAPSPPRRSRGRPRKSESKKGAHLRKSLPTSPSSARIPSDGPPRKRGRPRSTPKTEDGPARKRGRPKGSVNKNKAKNETQPDNTTPDDSQPDDSSAAAGVVYEEESVVEEVEQVVETVPVQDGENTEETLIEQDGSFELSSLLSEAVWSSV
ncbi:serine/arginine repetitive matrix protein 1-like [Scomber scombrus]|uniref:serine/arginine repetitive matrix protein 1-like n=1 Tax=Scomber scombrus TaxID=13677 RepID=UPI002DD98175|nr:serine/arginine repetitive matrix protein 1-like [Scomber scombrus]